MKLHKIHQEPPGRYIETGPINLDKVFNNLKSEMRIALLGGYKMRFNWDDDDFSSHELTVLNAAIRAAIKGACIDSVIPIYDLINTLLSEIEDSFVTTPRDGLKAYRKRKYTDIICDFEDTVDGFVLRNFGLRKLKKGEEK